MTESERLHGGLIFSGGLYRGLGSVCRVVCATLEDYGYTVDRQTLLSETEARVTSSSISVELNVIGLEDGRDRLVISMTTAGRHKVDPEEGQLVLLVMIYRIAELVDMNDVEWLDPDSVIPAYRFLGVFNKVVPRRVQTRPQETLNYDMEVQVHRFPPDAGAQDTAAQRHNAMPGTVTYSKPDPIDQQEAVARAFREDEEAVAAPCDVEEKDNDIRRLAAWGMTGVVTFMSLPVGVSMAAVNLLRGEDFRLNTQVLSLTGFLGFVTSTNMIGQMVSFLPV